MKRPNKLLDRLKISKDDQTFELNKGTIIEGIIAYFNLSYQNISVNLTFNNCLITKYFVDMNASEDFDRLLHNNSKYLQNVANQKNNFYILPFLLLIPEEIRNTIFKLYVDKKIPIDRARTLTRQQVQLVFDLSEKDIIFFLRGRMWIRHFTPPKKLPDGKDKRFAGESVEVLDALYQTYFPHGMWKDIKSILSEVLEEKLNFTVIDNVTFTKTFILVFKGMIEILLIDVLRESDRNKIESFTGYVLRKYFDKILFYTAENLLKFVENRDKNAEIFIKTFSNNVLIPSTPNNKYGTLFALKEDG
jgi:hypothetical protein